jgi:hypothetical protein
MSFLARIMARAHGAPTLARYAIPKGFPAISRAAEATEPPQEDAEVAPLRRTTVRRENAQPPTDEKQIEDQPAARQAAPDEKPDDDQNIAQKKPIRRSADTTPKTDDQTEAMPLRRVSASPPEEPKEEVEAAARSIRRAEEVPLDDGNKPLRQPFHAETLHGASPPHQDLADMEEPSTLQALRRDISLATPTNQTHSNTFGGDNSSIGSASTQTWANEPAPFFAAETGSNESRVTSNFGAHVTQSPSSDSRPEVIIDRIDVLIHEPAQAQWTSGQRQDLGRFMRTRYLRRL